MAWDGDLTLAEVNMNRKEHGLSQLKSLPAGQSRLEKVDSVRSQKREERRAVLTDKLLNYLGNSDNKPVKSRTEYKKILKISINYLLKIFTPDELTEIEKKALELRRLQYSNRMALIDDSLLEKAAEGKAPEVKLAYQRFEGWTEKTVTEVSNTLTLTLDAELRAMLDQGNRGAITVEPERENALLPAVI